MKSKDTIIDIDKYLADMGWIISRDGLPYTWLKQALDRQAEISFKAGEQAERERSSAALAESYFRGRQDGLVILGANIEEARKAGYEEEREVWNKAIDIASEQAFKAGIKEVVEWINSRHPNDIVTRAFWEEDWQTQVKEWGIDAN